VLHALKNATKDLSLCLKLGWVCVSASYWQVSSNVLLFFSQRVSGQDEPNPAI